MKYDKEAVDKMLHSLRNSLSTVQSTEFCLVWTYSFVSTKFYRKMSDYCIVGLPVCLESIPQQCKSFVKALSKYRRVFIHEGRLCASDKLKCIRHCSRQSIEELFQIVDIPQNAQDIFWRWYESGVIE